MVGIGCVMGVLVGGVRCGDCVVLFGEYGFLYSVVGIDGVVFWVGG